MKRFKQIFRKHGSALLALNLLLFFTLGCFKSDLDWKNNLAYKKLSNAQTSGSISDKFEFYFCPTGEYALKTSFVGMSGGFSMANEKVEFGNWRVESGTLILQPENGKTKHYSLSSGNDSNVIRLDNTGYLVTIQNECGR